MKASQNMPGVVLDVVCCGDGQVPGSAAGHVNLVIENLAEFSAAGVPGHCACIADCAVPAATGHDERESSRWTAQTAS